MCCAAVADGRGDICDGDSGARTRLRTQRDHQRLPRQHRVRLYAQYTHTHTHTQPFNGPLSVSGTTRVGRYQKKHSPAHTHPDHRTSFIIVNTCLVKCHSPFYRAMLCIRGTSHAPVSVSVCHKSVFYRNGWTNRTGFLHVSFHPPVLYSVKRKFGYLQI